MGGDAMQPPSYYPPPPADLNRRQGGISLGISRPGRPDHAGLLAPPHPRRETHLPPLKRVLYSAPLNRAARANRMRPADNALL